MTLDQLRAEMVDARAENRDLFCDASVRLWFCTVGSATKATWKQLA